MPSPTPLQDIVFEGAHMRLPDPCANGNYTTIRNEYALSRYKSAMLKEMYFDLCLRLVGFEKNPASGRMEEEYEACGDISYAGKVKRTERLVNSHDYKVNQKYIELGYFND